ncbi:MAG: hypothetical protein ACP5I8_11095 [Phycisphaerae bacterium]
MIPGDFPGSFCMRGNRMPWRIFFGAVCAKRKNGINNMTERRVLIAALKHYLIYFIHYIRRA